MIFLAREPTLLVSLTPSGAEKRFLQHRIRTGCGPIYITHGVHSVAQL